MIQVYEIPNTFTHDLPLDEQIAMGINDWRGECGRHVAFGHTRNEAINNLRAAVLAESHPEERPGHADGFDAAVEAA